MCEAIDGSRASAVGSRKSADLPTADLPTADLPIADLPLRTRP